MDRADSGLKYFTMGNGSQVVICHPSLGMGRFLFNRLIPPLSRRYTVISYDPRGVGDNAHLAPTMDGWVEDVHQLLEMVGKPAHLVGVSLGTWVMARVAANWPFLVERLVLMGTTPGFADGRAVLEARTQELQNISMQQFARWYVSNTLSSDVDAEIQEQMVIELASVDPEQYLKAMQAIYLEDNRSVFPQVKVPTLILVGSQDLRTPPAMADEADGLIPGSTVHVIPNAGHLALLDQPLRVWHILESYLQFGTIDD